MDKQGEQAAKHTVKVVVVGGGVSGLSAAFYTDKLFREQGIHADITLLEKSDRLGGKIQTLRRDGFYIEKGADSFLARKMPIIHLARELGLEDELTATNPQAKKTYILSRGRLHRMPPGLVLGIPTEVTPFIRTGLISPLGKIRAALDLILPKRESKEDESLGAFLKRRLGREVLEHIAEPLLAGIYAGDTYSLSLKSTFPQFHAVEQKYRSLIIGMIEGKKSKSQDAELPGIARNSMFLTFKQGLGTLIERLVEVLSDTKIHTNTGVIAIHKRENGYRVRLDTGEELDADLIVLALPTRGVGQLLHDVPEVKPLEQMPYVSVANVAMAFKQEDIPFNLDGTGFVIPRKEGRSITACTWTSSKWLHTAPEGKVLLRLYVGRSGEESLVDASDEVLLVKIRKDLQELMNITAEPLFYEITRLRNSMPQYPVGHLDNVNRLRDRLASSKPGMFLCGSGYHGVGVPDCVRQAKEAAQEMLQYWTNRKG